MYMYMYTWKEEIRLKVLNLHVHTQGTMYKSQFFKNRHLHVYMYVFT